MSSPIDVVLKKEGWDFAGRPPPRTRLTYKMVAKIIGAARCIEVDREEEQHEWDLRFCSLADTARQAEREKTQLQRQVFELTHKLAKFELVDRMVKIRLGDSDQNFLLEGPKQQDKDKEQAAA